jgi:small RNA 2'-O-methyltransferase
MSDRRAGPPPHSRRKRRPDPNRDAGRAGAQDVRGREETSSPLHEERLDAVMAQLLASGVESVVDLGCGSGSLLRRLAAEPQFRSIVGVDSSALALEVAQQQLTADGAAEDRATLWHGYVTDLDPDLGNFDAAVLVETIEHLDPADLGALERSVFARLRPRLVIITTPNCEYNVVLGVPAGRLRHAEHQFEWDRRSFGEWAEGVAGRHGYDVALHGIGPANALYGSATQMAVWHR